MTTWLKLQYRECLHDKGKNRAIFVSVVSRRASQIFLIKSGASRFSTTSSHKLRNLTSVTTSISSLHPKGSGTSTRIRQCKFETSVHTSSLLRARHAGRRRHCRKQRQIEGVELTRGSALLRAVPARSLPHDGPILVTTSL